jgi:hypothetical protein
MSENKEGQLRVWHIPQVPMEPFYVPVNNVKEAILVINVLEDYDNFEFDNHVKPDFMNATGLEVFEDGEWCEWYDEEGDDICDVMEREYD